MFSRAYDTTSLCLRCQLRQYRPLKALPVLVPDSPFLQNATPRRRLQSTAALEVDDNGEQHSSPPGASSLLETEDPQLHQLKQLKKSKKKSTNYRVWRPSPTAQLGMNALGKPSEVLLLSPRDRKIPVVPTDQTPEPKESFYEAVASETQPSTWEQVKENISQARHQIQPEMQQGALTPDAWVALKKILVAGFTLKQLRRYLEEEHHNTSDNARLPPLPKMAMAGKDSVIKAIAKHVWHYVIPTAQSRGTAQVADQASNKVYLLPRYNQTKQIALTRAPIDNVLRLANRSGVSIDFGEKNTTVTGPSDQASEIRQLIQQQAAALKSVYRNLPDVVSEKTVEALVDTLAQKHGLFASLLPRASGLLQLNMVCTSANENAADRLYHELCLAIYRHREKLSYRSNLSADQEVVWCSDYSPCVSHMLPLSKHLYRLHPRTIAKPAELGRPALRETVIPKLSVSPKDPSFEIEYVAEFGRGLFADVKDVKAVISQKESESSHPHCAFLPTMPLLQQFLSSRHLDKDTSAPNCDGENATARASYPTMTLIFSPLRAAHTGWQAIHVDTTAPNGQDESSPEQSLPRIQRIRVMEAQQSLCLLRPESVVDIKLSCRHWREVFSAESPTASALSQSLSKLLSKWARQSHEQSGVSVSDSESIRSITDPLLFLKQPSGPSNTTLLDDREKQGVKNKKKIESPDSESPVEKYILSDFYLPETESYSFQHKSRVYSVDHSSLIAQNPSLPLIMNERVQQQQQEQQGIPPPPFYDRQTLTLRHVISPSSAAPAAAAAAAASAEKKLKKGSKSAKSTTTTATTATTSENEKITEQVEDFIGAALSLAKKWQTEAANFRQRIEMQK